MIVPVQRVLEGAKLIALKERQGWTGPVATGTRSSVFTRSKLVASHRYELYAFALVIIR